MNRSCFKSVDPLTQSFLEWTVEKEIETIFDRVELSKSCPIGSSGACCRRCNMGPCRITGPDSEEKKGLCGATLSTIVARNFAQMCASGAAAHTDHARDMALTLLEISRGKNKHFSIKNEKKLHIVADYLGIDKNISKEQLAEKVAMKYLDQFGMYKEENNEVNYGSRSPEKRQEIWKKLDIYPRGIDREIVETIHRTNMGVDQDAENLLLAASKVSIADGWGSSLMSTEISDILFGTPEPVKGEVSLSVFDKNKVNLVVHGHEPTLAEMIVNIYDSPEIQEYAEKRGAKGVNIVGLCCTANELLVRHGIPSAGGFLQQELIITSGIIDAIVLDLQCIMPSLTQIAKDFHTKVITTSYKAKLPDAIHINYDKHDGIEIAKRICKIAIDNFSNRKRKFFQVQKSSEYLVGFSHDFFNSAFGGTIKPLVDSIVNGQIRGIVGMVGCNNIRVTHDSFHNYLVKELIKENILIIQTGCSAAASARAGFMTLEAASEAAGPSLGEFCRTMNIPPVLHFGSCVDNSRILLMASQIAKEAGLNDLEGLPCVGLAPEWMSEKAIAIGMYFVSSGIPVIFGGENSPVSSSSVVKNFMENSFWELFGAGLYFINKPEAILDKTIKMIDKAREKLGLITCSSTIRNENERMRMKNEIKIS